MAIVTDLTKGIWRRVYAGATKGKRINSVCAMAEVTFWRLHMICDDFGTFEAEPFICRTLALPLRKCTDKQVSKWLEELAKANLVTLYHVNGDRYGQIIDFEEMQPAGKNGRRVQRFPVNPGESGGIQKNPVNPNPSVRAQYEDEDEEPELEPDEDEAQGQVSLSSARASASCSSSSAAPSSCSQDSATSRHLAWAKLSVKAMALWSPGGSQKASDETDTRNVFDELVWPDGLPPPQCIQRVGTAIELIGKAKLKTTPMAWWKSELKRRMPAC